MWLLAAIAAFFFLFGGKDEYEEYLDKCDFHDDLCDHIDRAGGGGGNHLHLHDEKHLHLTYSDKLKEAQREYDEYLKNYKKLL